MNPFDKLFDEFWDKTVPALFRGNVGIKNLARVKFAELINEILRAGTTPEGARALAATHKIGRVLIAAKVIADDPHPDPEAIANAVQALIARLNPNEARQENKPL